MSDEAVLVGQAEVEHDEIRPPALPRLGRGRGVAGLDDVVVVAAEEHRDRLTGRLVILDEEDRGGSARGHRSAASAAAAASAAPAATRSGTVEVDGEPAERAGSGHDRSAHRLDQAADDREADARCRGGSPRPCAGRDRTSRTAAAGTRPGRPVRRPRRSPRTRPFGATAAAIRIGAPGPPYLAALSRVFDRIWPMNTSSTRTGGRSSGTSTVTGWPFDATSVRAKASRDEVGQGEHREVRPELPGLDPAHVEEVGDEPVEPLGLAVDGAGDLPALVGRPLDVGVHEHARGRPDGRERRPQVMGDGVEQRRLDRLAAPRDLGGGRLAAEPVALERPTDLVGGSGDDARLAGVGIAQLSRPERPRWRRACDRRRRWRRGRRSRRRIWRRPSASATGRAPEPIRPARRRGVDGAWRAPTGSSASRCQRVRCRPRSPRPPSIQTRLASDLARTTIPAIAVSADAGSRSVGEREADVEQRARLALAFGRRDRPVALAARQGDRPRCRRRAAG